MSRELLQIALSACLSLTAPFAARAETSPGPPTTTHPASDSSTPHDDVPPFVASRGDQPLNFAVTGLRRGSAKLGSGVRVFGVCWQGGAAPYEVTLRDRAANVVVHEAGLRSQELVEVSKTIDFAPGPYFIELTDGSARHTEGQFTVVEATTLPAPLTADSVSAHVAAAKTLVRADVDYSFEAYVRVVHDAVEAPGSDADQLAHALCHRGPPPAS